MNRASVNFKRMAWLALAAMLLAALMPTASRAIAAAADDAAPMLHGMCATLADEAFDASPVLADGHDAHADPATPMSHAMDDACGYCVLATPLPVLLVLPAPWTLLPRAASVPFPGSARPKPNRNLRGLGSQAPPPAL